MIGTDIESQGDPRYHFPPDESIITPERARMGDVFTGPDCNDCGATGKITNPDDNTIKSTCRSCHGRGWIGCVNTAEMDHKIRIRHAQVQVCSILRYLWDKEIITDDQYHDGGTFEIWRDQHQVAMGLKKAVCSGDDEEFETRLRAYGYILLVRRLSQRDICAIQYAINTFAVSHTEFIAFNRKTAYITAFGNLSRLLPNVKEQIRYLESISEDERNALCEGNLKILVARLVKLV